MGNSPQGVWGHEGSNLPENTSEKLMVRQLTAHSAEHHQELIVRLTRFKQYRCANVVQLVDSHTLQASNLCSVIVHVYAVMLRPAFTLNQYLKHLSAKNIPLCNRKLTKFLSDLIRALVYFKQEGNEVDRLTEDMVFIDEEGGQLVGKLMNPFFREESHQPDEGKGAVADLGALLKKYLRFELHSQDLIQTVSKMAAGTLSLEDLEQKYAGEARKGRARLKLTKLNHHEAYNCTSRAQRESLASVNSNGSSLLIEGGDPSDFNLKDLYQNLQGEISDIAEVPEDPLLTSCTIDDLSITHEFPKKYTKGRAFRKTQPVDDSAHSEDKVTSITRDQSLKDQLWVKEHGNVGREVMRLDTRQILLQSAKLVHSFIGDA